MRSRNHLGVPHAPALGRSFKYGPKGSRASVMAIDETGSIARILKAGACRGPPQDPAAQSPRLGFSMHYLAQHLTESEPMQTSTGRQLPRRTMLWLAANKLCHWCNRATLLSGTIAPDQATVDHRIPRGRGGPDTIQNVVSACRRCNDERNRRDMLSPGHKGGPGKRISTAEDLIAALGEISRQRDAAVQQLNAARAWNQRYLADLRMFLSQRSAV